MRSLSISVGDLSLLREREKADVAVTLSTIPTRRTNDFIKKVIMDCREIAKISGRGNDRTSRIYDPEFLCPTIITVSGGGNEIKIIERDRLPLHRKYAGWLLGESV